MHKKIKSLIVTTILLVSIILSTIVAIGGPNDTENQTVTNDCIELKKQIKTDQNEWVNEAQVIVGETYRFRITVTYHDVDGDGIGYMITYINITDTLPDGLEYIGNASTEETSIEGQQIIWRLGGLILSEEIEDVDQSYELEFDVKVTQTGEIVNHVFVEAMETCYHEQRYQNAEATLYSSYGHNTKQKDVDDDCKNETAIDQNDNSTDGYEQYEDPDGSSEAKKSKDGDNDEKIDHFIDTNDDEKPDKYWDPDDDILTDITIKDVDYDETDEWVFDSDDDGELDKYYDPDDDQIHDYITYQLNIETYGNGTVTKNPDDTSYLKDTEVTLTAQPDTNWSFDRWEGDKNLNESQNLTETIIINKDKTIQAYFLNIPPEEYTLNINVEGKGNVTKNPDQEKYTAGTKVTLTAIPDNNWTLNYWTGDLSGDETTIEITMNSNKTITAYFKEDSQQDTKNPYVELFKPKKGTLYRNNKEIMKIFLTTIIKGSIDITVEAYDNESGLDKVEVYIGKELKHTNQNKSFNWTWDENNILLKIKTIKIIAYDNAGNTNTTKLTVLKLGKLFKIGLISVVGASVFSFFKSKNQPTEDTDDSEDGTIKNEPPVAKAEGPSSGQQNKKVIFDASESYDPEEDQLTYTWDFGDGTNDTGKRVEHVYKKTRSYQVTLTVTDSEGSTDTTTLTIKIKKTDESETDNTFWIIAGVLGATLTSLLAAFYLRRKIYV